MDWETAVIVGRWTNIVLATTALGLLAWTIRGWAQRSAGNRFLWMSVILSTMNVIFGTAEQVLRGAAGGWRTAVTTVVLAWLIGGLILKARGQWTEDVTERRRRQRDDLRADRRFT